MRPVSVRRARSWRRMGSCAGLFGWAIRSRPLIRRCTWQRSDGFSSRIRYRSPTRPIRPIRFWPGFVIRLWSWVFSLEVMGAFARMCPALSELHCNTVDFSWKDVSAEVDLATVVEQLGLDPGYVPGSPPPSALRQAAWFVALLHQSTSPGRTVLDDALASHVRRVPPPSPASVH